jgi:hypothetical protein
VELRQISVAYEDEEDVITHWMSFENEKPRLSDVSYLVQVCAADNISMAKGEA